jgi:hypothetical protein
MKFISILLFFILLALLAPASAQNSNTATTATPVLVELFTSEGCSDCPPADALLAKLDQQYVPGAQVIVLSEHVDYWNHQGWTDPFSSALFTNRQQAYSARFGLNTIYTPQMVVDGDNQFVGSDGRQAVSAIERERSAQKLNVGISDVRREGDDLVFTLAAPAAEKHDADAYLALAQNHATSQVKDGENSGRTLSYVSVVRILTSVGEVKGDKPLNKTVRVKLGSLASNRDLRMIVFVQEHNAGRVLGATMKDLSGL